MPSDLMRVQFLGAGTPLGLRGLHQACILLDSGSHKVLLDCGMTALASLGRAGIEPGDIDAVVVSHLHGDHFGGLAPLLLHTTLRARAKPLVVAGPPATRERIRQALEVFGWTSVSMEAATFIALEHGVANQVAGWQVTAYSVPHNPATSPTALRLSRDGLTVGYSGDAGWSQALIDVARDADLFICSAWSFEDDDASFVDVATLIRKRAQLESRRLVLTHLGPEALERVGEVPFEVATDGTTVQL